MGWHPNSGFEAYNGPVQITPYQPQNTGAGRRLFTLLLVVFLVIAGWITALYITSDAVERGELRGFVGAGLCGGVVIIALVVAMVLLFQYFNKRDVENANELTTLRIQAAERQRLQLPPIIVQQPVANHQQWQPDTTEMLRSLMPPGNGGPGYRTIGED